MADTKPQTYDNHTRLVPMFHYVAFPILAINLIWSLYDLVQNFGAGAMRGVAVSFALVVVALFARIFALKAQDRVIRLEERMRMQQMLPDDLAARIGEFSTGQLVSLRFASDAELPELARKVLDDGIAEQKTIKQAIQNWRADYQRV